MQVSTRLAPLVLPLLLSLVRDMDALHAAPSPAVELILGRSYGTTVCRRFIIFFYQVLENGIISRMVFILSLDRISSICPAASQNDCAGSKGVGASAGPLYQVTP